MSKRKLLPRTSTYDNQIHGCEEFDDAPPGAWKILNQIADLPQEAKGYLLNKMCRPRPRSGAAATVTAPPENGPGPQLTFRWNGRVACLHESPYRYCLLVALWDQANRRPHSERSIDSVMAEVYAEEEDNCDALRDLCYQVRRELTAAKIGLTVRTRVGKMWLCPV